MVICVRLEAAFRYSFFELGSSINSSDAKGVCVRIGEVLSPLYMRRYRGAAGWLTYSCGGLNTRESRSLSV